ncbi:DUF2784 domain-containing protein [Fulvivirga sp. M361]|uniref:DUF2784 family protein n=1 Tax=Fulvivirga sp. M361 TaxID=2594266 RepID=UPI00117B1BA5|nr:DUF2784 family protein [Fulvivirga sp. M361]TRX49338.1 DUF2784 domain-containing protein [Fulvivirga sp. M361]
MLKILDITLFSLHVLIILANLFAWLWKRTQRLHLWIVGATLFSWLVLGIWNGFGYCILTDWEWDIKRTLGERDLPHSFTQYLSDNVFGLYLSPAVVDGLTVGCFLAAIIGSCYVNFVRKDNTN